MPFLPSSLLILSLKLSLDHMTRKFTLYTVILIAAVLAARSAGSAVSITLRSSRLNVTSTSDDGNEPLFLFQDLTTDANTYMLHLSGVFEASQAKDKRFIEANDTEIDLDSLEWNIIQLPPDNNSAGVATILLSASLKPDEAAKLSNGTTVPRFTKFDILMSLNQTSQLNLSQANITVNIDGFRWESDVVDNYLVLLWRLAKQGDGAEDQSTLKSSLEARSATSYFKVSGNAKSLDRSVSVRLQHSPNVTTVGADEHAGIWVVYSHFTSQLSHVSVFGIGEPGGKGGRGGGSSKSFAATVALIIGSIILVTLAVFGVVYYNIKRKERQASVARY